MALELATKASEKCESKDWWWKAMIGICHYRLGMFQVGFEHEENPVSH